MVLVYHISHGPPVDRNVSDSVIFELPLHLLPEEHESPPLLTLHAPTVSLAVVSLIARSLCSIKTGVMNVTEAGAHILSV